MSPGRVDSRLPDGNTDRISRAVSNPDCGTSITITFYDEHDLAPPHL